MDRRLLIQLTTNVNQDMNAQLEASTQELNSAILATFVPIQVQLHGRNNLVEMTP